MSRSVASAISEALLNVLFAFRSAMSLVSSRLTQAHTTSELIRSAVRMLVPSVNALAGVRPRITSLRVVSPPLTSARVDGVKVDDRFVETPLLFWLTDVEALPSCRDGAVDGFEGVFE